MIDPAWTPYITTALGIIPPAVLWIATQVFETKRDAGKKKEEQTDRIHTLEKALTEVRSSIHSSVNDSAQEIKSGFNAANSLLRADFFAEMERDRNLNREQTRETQSMIRELTKLVQKLDKTVAVVKSENKSRSDADSEVDA